MFVHVEEVAALGGAEAVFDAVVPGQVGTGLRRGDDVINRQTVFGVGQGDLD